MFCPHLEPFVGGDDRGDGGAIVCEVEGERRQGDPIVEKGGRHVG